MNDVDERVRRVLVTGATGMLGSVLVPSLKQQGWVVLTHTRRRAADFVADLGSADEAVELIRRARPDAVVNLVAATDVDECDRNPVRAFAANTASVEYLCQGLDVAAPEAFLVHVSSDQVYDGEGPHREEAARPSNVYALTKYAGELAARSRPSAILRTNFFGVSPFDGRKSFSDWVVSELSSGNSLNVFTDVRFSPLTMRCLSSLVGEFLERRVQGTYNVGSRDGCTKAEFAFALARKWGLPEALLSACPMEMGGLRAYRPCDMRMDVSRVEAALGWRMPSIEEEIEGLWRRSRAQTEQ